METILSDLDNNIKMIILIKIQITKKNYKDSADEIFFKLNKYIKLSLDILNKNEFLNLLKKDIIEDIKKKIEIINDINDLIKNNLIIEDLPEIINAFISNTNYIIDLLKNNSSKKDLKNEEKDIDSYKNLEKDISDKKIKSKSPQKKEKKIEFFQILTKK